MELTGLSMTQVLTTLGVAGGLIVVLYLLKLRRRQVTVPFVKLWEQVLAEKQTTRLFSQLKRILSLLIALAIAAALAFALGDPRYLGASATGRTLVVLVDASASMQATDADPSRLEAAKTHIEAMIDELGPADKMLIAQMDSATTPLSPLSSETRLLKDSLSSLSASDVAADFARGLRFARDVLRDQSEPEVVLLSDGRLEDPGESAQAALDAGIRLSYVSVGEGSRNVGITAFSVRRYPLDKSQSEVLVELYNPSDNDEEVELTLLGDGEAVEVEQLTVRKGERHRRFFQNVSGADQTLEARLSFPDGTHDSLPADDRAYARLPERRRARILCVTDGNLYLQAALLLDEYLDVVEITPAQYPAEGRFDVTIFDNFVPPAAPNTHSIYLNPTPASEEAWAPLAVEGEFERPYFDQVDRDHPVVRFMALGDVNVGASLGVQLLPEDKQIAGDRGAPLIVSGTRNQKHFVALTFDIRVSDFPLRVAWPLFLLNSIDWFLEEDTGYVSSYQTGETWHIPVSGNAPTATITDPSGDSREVPVVDGRAVYAGTEAGFYQVAAGPPEAAAPDGSNAPDQEAPPSEETEETETSADTSTFAANLGPGEEGRIAPEPALSFNGEVMGPPSQGKVGVRKELWVYLVFFAFLVLIGEWFTYHRRWTV